MIQLLILDDDSNKAKQIEELVLDILGSDNVAIEVAKSFVSGCTKLEHQQFDILVLDLLLPREDSDVPQDSLGIGVLKIISQGGPRLFRPKYVVGLTAHEELDKECSKFFSDNGWHLLYFDPKNSAWSSVLANVLIHAAEVSSDSEGEFGCDLAIVTALTHTEFEYVQALPAGWTEAPKGGDPYIYYRGHFENEKTRISVCSVSVSRMGMAATGIVATNTINLFRPRFLAMVGIAAGVKGGYGDILIADQSWDYGSGKSIFDDGNLTFEPAPEPIPISCFLRSRLAQFRTRRDILAKIRSRWTGEAPSILKAELGAMASGAAVLENRPLIEKILEGNRKLIGIEMETYGVFLAGHLCSVPRPQVLSIKSLCDLGTAGEKKDNFQEYAAFTSANFLFEFALEYLGKPLEK